MVFKPMLASNVTEEQIARLLEDGPLYVSAKIDGMRATVRDEVVLSRSLKPIPNRHVQEKFGKSYYEKLDGELVVGLPYGPDVLRNTGAIRREEGTPDVEFWVFDIQDESMLWNDRLDYLQTYTNVALVTHLKMHSLAAILEYEQEALEVGFEGLVLRTPYSRYKQGRATVTEGEMLKLKRSADSEALILGIEEKMHNANVAKINALGRTERSSHKENKVGTGTMGSLRVRDLFSGVEFNIGTGFTEEQRAWFWDNQDELISNNGIVKYKYLPIGIKDAPRHPVYLALRDKWDMS